MISSPVKYSSAIEQTAKSIIEFVDMYGRMPDKVFVDYGAWERLRKEVKEIMDRQNRPMYELPENFTNFLFMGVPIGITEAFLRM